MFLDLIPARGAARRLGGLTLVQSAANGLFLTSSAVFFVRVVGLRPAEVGLGLSLGGLAGLLTTVPVGRLADRYGAGWLLAGNYALLALLFAAYPLVQGLASFILVASLISIGEITGSPLRAAAMHALFGPKEAVRVRAQVRSVYNVGFMGGAAVAALALANPGYPAFWAVCGITSAAQAVCVLVVRWLRVPSVARPASATSRPALGTALRDGRFVAVTAGNGLLELHFVLLTLGVPLWIVSHTTASPSLVAAVVMINTVMALLLQVRASRGAETVAGSARLLRRAGFLLAAGCGVSAASTGAGPVVAAVVLLAGAAVLTLGEVTQSAGGWGLAFELAAPGRQGEYQSVFSLGRGIQQFLGPAVVSTLLVDFGVLGWLVLGALFAGTGVGVAGLVLARKPGRHRRPRTGLRPHRRPGSGTHPTGIAATARAGT